MLRLLPTCKLTGLLANLLTVLSLLTFPLLVHANNTNEPAALNITLNYTELSLNYSTPARLSQVLVDIENNQIKNGQRQFKPFWLGAQWIEPEKIHLIHQMQGPLIKELSYLPLTNQGLAVKTEILLDTIQNGIFNYRHFISLDKDLVRMTDDLNPLLSGSFVLLTEVRPEKIRIVGTESTQYLSFIEHGSLGGYLEQLNLPEYSDTEKVYVIQPDGKVIIAHNSYWNTSPVFIAPGATLFIGFSSLPDGYDELNMQIAELLRHQAPLHYLPPKTDKDTH